LKQVVLKRIISLLMVIVLVFSQAGCGGDAGGEKSARDKGDSGSVFDDTEEWWKIPIDENGVASWQPVEGAVAYIVDFVRPYEGCPLLTHEEQTTETLIQVPQGYSVQVCALFADGSTGEMYISDYYGEYVAELDPYYGEIPQPGDDPENSDRLAGLSTWDIMTTLDRSSFKEGADGKVYFEGAAPTGEPIRFCGFDMELTADGILFHENGWLVSLDSIGRISGIDFNVLEGNPEDWISVFGGFSLDRSMNPSDITDICFSNGMSNPLESYIGPHIKFDHLYQYEAYFMGVGVQSPHYKVGDFTFTQDVLIDQVTVYYAPANECKPFKELVLSENSYGSYLEGETYDRSREVFEPYEGLGLFELYAIPDLDVDANEPAKALVKAYPDTAGVNLYPDMYTIGDLKDASGKVLDKDKDPLSKGTKLTINVGGIDYDVDIHVVSRYMGAKTMHDLVPYAFPSGTGQRNALVIPIAWSDQPESSTQEVYDMFKSELGRVAQLGIETTPKDYSDNTSDNRYSLTKYFDTVSYGKFHLDNYMTTWYPHPKGFLEALSYELEAWEFSQIEEWLYNTYPDTDWTQFDLDKNGYFDTVILLNAGKNSDSDSFSIMSYEGAIQFRQTYGSEYAGTPDRPSLVNNIVTVNANQFDDNALLHEFSHSFGLIDYYDVTYSGINAVGGYDMQSDSAGDWNPYSKYAVGWIDPTVVKDLKPGESVDIEIGSFADTGDAVVIPYVGEDVEPPFCEYMMVDLFTDTGVNPAFTGKYGLSGACGVRMYHVDAVMERRDYVSYLQPDMTPCPIGTVHFANNNTGDGRFNLELIQAGGKNTFTDIKNLRTNLQKNDLFKAGDTFTMSKYSQFFENGLMDYGDDFGYSIKVVSITGSGSKAKAVIRITRQ